jgi:D-arabinose 1-dehydrogenase-like Zn-dependent alcohol dehydrogenase
MVSTTSLIALMAIVCLYHALREKSTGNTRDAKLLGVGGTALLALAGAPWLVV